jgi:hypothetical protein
MLKWVSYLLVIIIVACMLTPHILGSLGNGIIVGSLLTASLGLLVYLVVGWKSLSVLQRWGISLSIIVWLTLMYSFIR